MSLLRTTNEFDPYLHWLGIPPSERPIDHYRLLGMEHFEDKLEVIAEAADQRMILIRSFQTGPRGTYTQHLLNELTAAKICLLNPNTKATYDAVLEGQLAAHLVKNPDSVEAPPISESHRVKSRLNDVVPPPLPSEQQDANEKSPKRQSTSLAPRSWLPIAAVAGVVVIAVVVWAVGTSLATQKVKTRVKQTIDTDQASRKNKDDGSKVKASRKDDEKISIVQEGDGSFNFPASVATVHGKNLRLDQREGEGLITNWSSKDDWLSWNFNVIKGGFFRAEVAYLVDKTSNGGRFLVSISDQEKSIDVQTVESPGQSVTDEFILILKNRGPNQIEMRALEIAGDELLTLKGIRLIPRQ